MIAEEPRTRRFSRDEYYCMAELGWFNGKRVELLEGEVVEMSPQMSWHACAIMLANMLFTKRLPAGWSVRIQLPLAFGLASEPEPDVAIVKGEAQDFAASHPTSAVLIIEVAESSLIHDRKRKASVYAKAGIPEYWIVNLIDNIIEVYREPVVVEGPYGHGYKARTDYRRGDTLTPLFLPNFQIAAGDLLPIR